MGQDKTTSAMSTLAEVAAPKRERVAREREVKVQSYQLVAASNVSDELVCKLCYDVVGCAPKLTKCAHLFCGDCLSKWFTAPAVTHSWAQREHDSGLVPCPVCQEPLREDRDLFTLRSDGSDGNRLLWSILHQTKLRCVNHSSCRADATCDWIGEYGSYQAHIRQCRNVRAAYFSALSFGLAAKACGGLVQVELRDGAESFSTESDLLDEDNGETSSDGDFTACEASAAARSQYPVDVLTLDATRSQCPAQDIQNTSSEGRHVRTTACASEGTPLLEEIPANERMTRGDMAFDDSTLSKSLVSSISALLELKLQDKDREVVRDTGATSMQPVEQQKAQAAQKHSLKHKSPQSSRQEQMETLPPAFDDKVLMHQQQQAALDMHHQQVRMTAAHGQQVAHWQHAQMAQSAYAAQAAQMQYACQWKAAQMQFAPQWPAPHMQPAAYAAHAALSANSRK